MTDRLPDGLVPGGASPAFSQDTLPDALQAEHTLGPGHWAVLNVLEGSLRFVNIERGEERVIPAPDCVTIRPGMPHRVAIEGPLRCRIDFFREAPVQEAAMATETNKRVHIERAGVVSMALPAAEAFPLFNAEGERQWVAGWAPRYLHRAGSGVGEGVVFQTTREGVGTATWTQTRHDPARGVASFVFVYPEHHAAIVDVGVTPDASGRSRASVRYRMTSLSPDADEYVRSFGEAFDGFMVHWEEAIQRHIVEGVPLGA